MKKIIITILTAIVLAIQPAVIGSIIVNAAPPADSLIAATTSNMPTIPKPDLLPGPTGTTQGSVQSYFREKALPSAISTIIGIVGVAAFISLLISGIQFLTAYGNEEKVGAAKKTAIYAIMGFLIAIFAYAIVSIISSLPISSTTSGTPTTTSTSSTTAPATTTSSTTPTDTSTSSNTSTPSTTSSTDWEHQSTTPYRITPPSEPSHRIVPISLFSIPTAYANIEEDLGQLLPSTSTLIDQSPNAQGASLPTGDLMSQTLPKIIKIIMYAVGTVILIAIVYAGILLVIARGNEESIKKAENIMIYGAIGVVIIGIAYAIVHGISQLNI